MVEARQSLHEALQRATAQLNCPAALMTLARYKASTAVKAHWLAQGRRLSELALADIRVGAEAYLAEHPELFEQAAETIERSSKLRKLAEREARERARRAKLSSDAQFKNCWGASTSTVHMLCAENGGSHMVARTLADLQQEYRPYDTLPAFHQGFAAYGQQYQIRNPYEGQPHDSVNAQAWARGLECAERWAKERRS